MAGKIPESEVAELKAVFASFDKDSSGHIDAKELKAVLKELKMYESESQVHGLIAEVDANKSGTIEFNEFLDIVLAIKAGKGGSLKFAKVYSKQKELVQVQGTVGVHSFAEEEMAAFSEHLNQCLGQDKDLKHLMPLESKGMDLCKKVKDGLLIAKFVNVAIPETIDERALNKVVGKDGKVRELTLFQINENQNLGIAAAKSIGVVTTNVGAAEMVAGEKHPHLVLGMVWQLVKIQLLNSISLKNHPELIRLLEEGEELADLMKLTPEQLLLRWFNYHLKAAGSSKRVKNFSSDVKDSEAYTILLNQIAPGTCDKSALSQSDPLKRADKVLGNAKKLGVKPFLKNSDITGGNARLNLAFTAAIFNQCPGLDPISKEELDKVGLMDDDFGDSREERAFRMWINSLGAKDLYMNSLFEDVKDGLGLLKVIDHIEPGLVDWKQVEKQPNNKFKKVSNNNYAVVLGKAKELNLSLVGIGGSDIVDGNKKLILGFVWQLMRHHTLKFLAQVQSKKFGGKPVTDDMIIAWANDTVKASGKDSKMSGFKDPSLADSLFFIDLLAAVEPRVIAWENVNEGKSPDDKLQNARYAISVARKLGAVIFLLPEDIVEVKPKMILTFIASIMSVQK
jgi:plastin-1